MLYTQIVAVSQRKDTQITNEYQQHILLWKWLFDGTVPSNKKLFDGTVPSNKKLYDGTPKKGERGRDVGWKGWGQEGAG